MSSSTYLGSHTFLVTGMTCEHCRRAVTEEIGAIDGVESVRVELGTGCVDITTSRPVHHAEIAAAVDEAGYTLGPR